jgi:hypothetical protein
VSCAAGKEELPRQGRERGIEQGIILLPKGREPEGHLPKEPHPGNIQGRESRGGTENPTHKNSVVPELIQMNPQGDIQGRRKDTINKDPMEIPRCKGIIQSDIEETKECRIHQIEGKEPIMMKEGKTHMAEEGKERGPIQGTTRDIGRGWTGMLESQVIGNLEEITAQTAVERC